MRGGKRNKIVWTLEQEEEIIKLYSEGLSALEVATKFGVSISIILKKLRSLGIVIRPAKVYFTKDLICSDCKEVLTDQNYPDYIKKSRSKICKFCRTKRSTNWRLNNSEKFYRYSKQYYLETKEISSLKKKKDRRMLKHEVLSYYSQGEPKCNICDFKDERALSLDHINGGGNEHRRSISNTRISGWNFYRWVKKNNYPSDLQVLCMNCQFIKTVENYEYNKEC